MRDLFFASRSKCAATALLAALPLFSHAERADREKPLTVAADRQGTIDMQKQTVVFSGNVVLTKGTLLIKAERVEVREGRDGYRVATAIGSNGKPATLRQKRDGVDEFIDGRAERLEYEERGDQVRFINDAVVRRLRGTTVADEITGNLITYSAATEIFNVSAGAAAGGGRVQAVLAPRAGTEAAQDAAPRVPAGALPR